MSNHSIYFETGSNNPFYNLAFEEYLLHSRTSGNLLMLWQNKNAVIIGQNQNAEEEINRAFVEEHGIAVARRTTGGGAVYHDLGNLNYSFITDAGGADRMNFERFALPVVSALRAMGLNSDMSGRNDILVDSRKVSGTAQRIVGDRILHHGTLLFDSNLDMASGALNADPEKFHSKSSKSVRSRIVNIKSCLSMPMSMEEFWNRIKDALGEDGLAQGRLSLEDLSAIEQLKENKYDRWEWNFGRSPRYDFRNKKRWDGGTLEVLVQVEGGRIAELSFFGDFMSVLPMDSIIHELKGCIFRREDVAAALDRFCLSPYFGSITKEDILKTMFYAG